MSNLPTFVVGHILLIEQMEKLHSTQMITLPPG